MIELIKKFSDGSYYEFREGNFNKFCIFYVDANGNGKQVDGKWLLEIASAFGKQNSDKHLKFNSFIDKIGESEYKNREWLSEIIEKYEHEFKSNKLILEKVSYLMLGIFHAEDNWVNPETGKPSIFKRRMYLSEIKRVGVLGQNVEMVCDMYKKGTLSSVIENLIYETNDMIEIMKGNQRTLAEWF